MEPFICDCISISKRLAKAIDPFTLEEMPANIEEAKKSITKHKLERRRTLDSLHMDELSDEGEKINERMQGTYRGFRDNPDFTNTLATIKKLLAQIGTVKERLEVLWDTRHDKLKANFEQRKFEVEAEKVGQLV